MSWVIVEQSEGLLVDYNASEDVDVFFVDYDEARRGYEGYAEERLDKIDSLLSGAIKGSLQEVLLSNVKEELERIISKRGNDDTRKKSLQNGESSSLHWY